jgi:hypothetical protein
MRMVLLNLQMLASSPARMLLTAQMVQQSS